MNEPRPAATVVVPSRGGAARLPRLMDLLAAQDRNDFEVIVVVDGDVDDTAGVLADRTGGPPLTVHVLPENRGRSVALNTGFDLATGSVLIRCDDDLEPGPHFVSGHVSTHEGADVGVVGLYRNLFPDTPYARVYGRRADERFRRQAYACPASMRWRYWAGNVSVTRETYDDVGPYDIGYRAYGWEDVDWGYRLHRSGRAVLLDPELETTHRLTATTTSARALRAFYSGAARRTFAERHGHDVLPNGRPSGAWGAAVRTAAAVLDEARLDRAARAVDRALPAAPRALGEKMVALLVEAGHLAGTRIAEVSDSQAV